MMLTRNITPKYVAGVQPYFQALSKLLLPPRGRKGSRVNRMRTLLVCAAMHQTKHPHGIGCPLRKIKKPCKLCRTRVTYA